MTRPDDALTALGRELGAAQDEQLDSLRADLAGARAERVAALVAEEDEDAERGAFRARPGRRRYWPLAAAAVVALAAGIALGAVLGVQWLGGDDEPSLDGPPLTFIAGEDHAPGIVGTAYEAAPGIENVLRFTDGTELRLGGRPGGRARVESVDPAGARVVLDEGAVSAAVVPLRGARWTVTAGPFAVQVVGTRFRVEWTPRSSVFRLTLEEGTVVLSGPLLDGGRRVSAGEAVLVNLAAGSVLVETLPAAAPASADRATAVAEPRAAAAPARAGAPSLAPAAAPAPAPSAASISTDWRALYADRLYEEAFAAAHAIGFAHLASTSDAETLLLLGDVARYAKKRDAAMLVYTAIRARFPGHAHARDAAFHLGRLALAGTPDASVARGAVRWLEAYLVEAPDGAYAREATGRLIEANELAGDFPAARSAAASYLARYRDGPHSAVARGVLGRGSSRPGTAVGSTSSATAATGPRTAAGAGPTAAPAAAPR